MVIDVNIHFKKLKPIAWALLLAILALAGWYACRPTLFHTALSPRQVYRLEYYEASPIRHLTHWDYKMPSFVRLHRIEPPALLGESDVVDLWLNGETYWWLKPPVNAVRVGRDVVFENIPPECTDCPPLADGQAMTP